MTKIEKVSAKLLIIKKENWKRINLKILEKKVTKLIHKKINAPRKITGWQFANNRDFTVKPQHNVIKMSKIYNSW